MKEHNYYIYITTNPNRGVLYIGVTNNLARRLVEHYANRGKKETFAGRYYAYNLIYFEHFKYINDAIAREKELKDWNRQRKEDLIKILNPKWNFLNKDFCQEWPPKQIWGRYLENFQKRKGITHKPHSAGKNIYIYDKHKDPEPFPQETQPVFPQGTKGNEEPVLPQETLYAQGMKTRRSVLGDAHVDRAEANKTDFDKDFQEYIINSAWGSIWSRPHLTKRERSMITIAVLAVLGHYDEVAMHIRATQNTGATEEDVKEVLLHIGVYAGVPVTNHCMKIAKKVYQELNNTDKPPVLPKGTTND